MKVKCDVEIEMELTLLPVSQSFAQTWGVFALFNQLNSEYTKVSRGLGHAIVKTRAHPANKMIKASNLIV